MYILKRRDKSSPILCTYHQDLESRDKEVMKDAGWSGNLIYCHKHIYETYMLYKFIDNHEMAAIISDNSISEFCGTMG